MKIDHRSTFKKPLSVKVTPLTVSSEKTGIVNVEYEDPYGTGGTWSKDKVEKLLPALIYWVGYLVDEDDKYLRLAYGLFEYENGDIEFEEPHVILKNVIKKKNFMS